VKLAAYLLCAALLQARVAASPKPLSDTSRLRYQRAVILPEAASGEACAVLDATVFAHTASRSADDLRLFRTSSPNDSIETPFVLTESESQPGDTDAARIRNVKLKTGHISFDLDMPSRPYSRVNVQLALQDFYGIATVTGSNASNSAPVFLGSFALFDLTSRHLARSTTLPLPESTFPHLHVELQLWDLAHNSLANLSADILQGASVPPTRESQTLFTSIAATTSFTQQGSRSVATLRIPAHVPIERIAFALQPGFDDDFLRRVTITAIPASASSAADKETVTGEISSVSLPRALGDQVAAVRMLTLDAALAANLRSDATVEIAIGNDANPPLPIQSVELQMRQRSLCFHAEQGTQYMLRYGDKALHPPVYQTEEVKAVQTTSAPAIAILGPQQINAAYLVEDDTKTYTEGHPELLWIALLAAVAALGAGLRHHLKHRRTEAGKRD
jgi:hypothetical protein